jgi:hypothetical protein
MAAKSYRGLSEGANQTFDETVFSDYIRNKVRANDEENSVYVVDSLGKIIKDNTTSGEFLMLKNDEDVYTYIYSYKGKLMEITKNKDEAINKSSGNVILEGDYFRVKNVSDHLMKCTFKINGENVSCYIGTGAN